MVDNEHGDDAPSPPHNPGEPSFGEGHGGEHNPGEFRFGDGGEDLEGAEDSEHGAADEAADRAEGHS